MTGLLIFLFIVVVLYFVLTFEGAKKIELQQRGVAVTQPIQGESAIYRNIKAQNLVNGIPGYSSLHDLLKKATEKYEDKKCLGARPLVKIVKEDKVIDGVTKQWEYFQLGDYKWYSYKKTLKKCMKFGSGLVSLGVKRGDVIGIFEETRPEWTLSAHSCFSQGITVATVYSNLGEEGLTFAVQEGELSLLITNGKLLKSILNVKSKCPSLKTIIYIDEGDNNTIQQLTTLGVKVIQFDEVFKIGKQNLLASNPGTGEDIAVIMYTSGSTGAPKGVMIRHNNLLSMIGAVADCVHLNKDDVYISYLPLAHVLALAAECAVLSRGAKCGYANPRSLLDSTVRHCKGDLRELSPTIMAGVPTVWDRVRKGALAKIEASPSFAKKLFQLAFDAKSKSLDRGYSGPLWANLILKKFKETLGGQTRFILSGGAPLSVETHRFLRVCFGIPVIQGYGLTETCGGGTIQELDEAICGRVGPPILCTEIKLTDVIDMGYRATDNPPRGEIWIRGPNIALGYFKQPEKSKEDFRHGWFVTGDIGIMHPNGTLQIIDRKKNLVKLSHGEYIALEKLEAIYKASKFVENICVYGDSFRAFPIAIICVNKLAASKWAEENNTSQDIDKLCENNNFNKAILASLTEVGRKAGIKAFEFIKAVVLTSDEWTPDNGLLTAAMKIKRMDIQKQFNNHIEKTYKSVRDA
eukprot:TRINITY_DN112_c0_g1_i1.p1 TRINITY_DN112_c0_g1~~TRINITY_DN112_c0_g1_i1.p1  ORF type:complete len:691 (-),score=333.19 TRINITY_DN112_c0_g1_i1:98-2170(-)